MSQHREIPSPKAEQRIGLRFNKAFPVRIGSELFGSVGGIARNISAGGMLVEMYDPLPLGSFVSVCFEAPRDGGEIVARAEVKHHYCLNYSSGAEPCSARGIGLRFVEFEENADDQLTQSLRRVLH